MMFELDRSTGAFGSAVLVRGSWSAGILPATNAVRRELGGPSALRYFLDYNYFLYFLVLHVTFSFRPILRRATSK
jgi:hypothetical protein